MGNAALYAHQPLLVFVLLQVKNAVASPAGTTVSGILVLEKSGFRGAMISAVKAAVDRAVELRQS